MKIYWSAFLSLLFLLALAGCGQEQFGTTPTSAEQPANPLQVYQQSSCSGHTLIKPEVDILYVVDNSSSANWVSGSVKSAIQNTINSISSQFDYRVIGTPLLPTTLGDDDYQVLSKSQTALPSSIPSTKVVTSSSQFSFFSKDPADPHAPEAGLRRIREFITAHQTDGLFRQNSYILIVLVSNGRDTEIETKPVGQPTQQNTTLFNSTKNALLQLKSYFQSQQFRLMSLTANTSCQTGYWESSKSYGAMSQALYDAHPGFPAQTNADHYDICGSAVSTVFANVNSSIQQVIIPHSYKYWPITSTDGVIDTNPGKIRVFKSSPSSAPVELTSGWSYVPNPNYPGPIETRVDPDTGAAIAGEPTSRKHLIQFNSGSYITYPDCVAITTSSNVEYFGYIVIPKIPNLASVIIKINGTTIPASGYSYIGQQSRNIKVAHNGYPATPEVLKSGYMFQLNSSYYYKSGDNVEIYYIPESN